MLTPQIVVPIIGDGVCLFRSISFHLFNTQERCQEIQNTIVSYVSDNWNNFTTMSYNSNDDNFSTAVAYIREMVNPTVYGGYWELVEAGNIFPFSFQIYYNNNLYAKFGVDTFSVKSLSLTENINSGHFDVYLSIPNIHNVAVNLIITSEGDLSIFNNVSVTENNKTRINQVKKAITKYKAIKHQETLGFPTKITLFKWKIKKLSGLAYNPTIDYKNNISTMYQKCNFCNALKWKGETHGMCCNIGKTELDPLQPPPEPLRSLLDHDHFINLTRKYNSCFQMASFGAKQIVEEGFMPTFKVQGQVYHLYGSLILNTQENPQFLQIYFVGVVNTLQELTYKIYPGIENLKEISMDWLCERAILTSKNDTAEEINKILLGSFQAKKIEYRSVNSVLEIDDAVHYPVEFPNYNKNKYMPKYRSKPSTLVSYFLKSRNIILRICVFLISIF
ncbi:hypothetical protein QTP88_026975 [Uroleucon formosanum]